MKARPPGETFRTRSLTLIQALVELENAARSFVDGSMGNEYSRNRLAGAAMSFTAAAPTLSRNRRDR